MIRRFPSVTRRHIEFLSNHEETVMRLADLARLAGATESDIEIRYLTGAGLLAEGDWQLPTTDDDHVGED